MEATQATPVGLEKPHTQRYTLFDLLSPQVPAESTGSGRVYELPSPQNEPGRPLSINQIASGT